MSDLNGWLPLLVPAPGGYARLSAALAARQARARGRFGRARLAWVAAASAVVFIALAPLLHVPHPQRQQARQIAASLEQAWALGDQDIVVSDGAAAQILKAPGLRVYWVGVVGTNASQSEGAIR